MRYENLKKPNKGPKTHIVDNIGREKKKEGGAFLQFFSDVDRCPSLLVLHTPEGKKN